MSAEPAELPVRHKNCYVGAPAIFLLEQACQHIGAAYPDSFGCYLVGSALERPDWRDVDVRMIAPDADFRLLFPDVEHLANASWECDPRWLLLTTALSAWLRQQTGLPVDFQIQPQGYANERHNKRRHALGMRLSR